MNKMFKRVLAVLIACFLMAASFAACTQKSEKEKEPTSTEPTATEPTEPTATEPTEPKAYYDMLDLVTDSSDLPDWTGKQLKLKVWKAHSTGYANRAGSSNDVVTPEVKRVTGVELDKEESFDNGGQAIDVKMAMLSATNDWPHIAHVASQADKWYDLIAAGKIYDLTDALKKYAPQMLKKIPVDDLVGVKEMITYPEDGKIYFAPVSANSTLALEIYPDLDPNKFQFIVPAHSRGLFTFVYIRDDILKKLYPNAKSMDEIEALYMKNGKFTREEIFDVPIRTKEEFIKFLYDIKDLIDKEKIMENGRPLEVTYAFSGTDNWPLVNNFLGSFTGIPGNNNYFTYYDKTTGQMEYHFKQDWFKDSMLMLNRLVRDGVMAPDSLLNNNAAFREILTGGGYVLSYDLAPTPAALKAADKTFRYRPLWIDQEYQDDKFISPAVPAGSETIVIFKDSVKEEDLPQILRYLNFMVSDVGEKLMYWGPRSAGLYEEKDGKRVYKDKELEDSMVYGVDNGNALKYNLHNPFVGSTALTGSAWPHYPTYMNWGSPLSPRYTYDRVMNPADARMAFTSAVLPGLSWQENQTLLAFNTRFWGAAKDIPEIERFWNARQSFEQALTRTLAADSDEHFEAVYKSFVDVAVRNGATDETLKEFEKLWREKNEGYLEKLK